MRAYEIHTFRNGRWKIDSVFDDKELALFEAHRMDGSGRFSGVRVVEEAFDENDNKTSARTIFRGSKATQANQKGANATSRSQSRQDAEIERRRKAARDAERRRIQQRKAKKKRDETNPYRLATILLLLALFGLGALYTLEHLRNTL